MRRPLIGLLAAILLTTTPLSPSWPNDHACDDSRHTSSPTMDPDLDTLFEAFPEDIEALAPRRPFLEIAGYEFEYDYALNVLGFDLMDEVVKEPNFAGYLRVVEFGPHSAPAQIWCIVIDLRTQKIVANVEAGHGFCLFRAESSLLVTESYVTLSDPLGRWVEIVQRHYYLWIDDERLEQQASVQSPRVEFAATRRYPGYSSG